MLKYTNFKKGEPNLEKLKNCLDNGGHYSSLCAGNTLICQNGNIELKYRLITERIVKRYLVMLKTRVITGGFITIIIAGVVLLSHIPWVLNTAIACLSLLAAYELFRATGLKGNKPVYYISCASALFISFITLPGYPYIITILFIAAVLLFANLMARVKTLKSAGNATYVMIFIIIVFFFKTMSAVRAMENGLYLLGTVFLVTAVTDIAAYFIGKGCGRHKLAPTISPKKTIEGSIGGTLSAIVILLLVAIILKNNTFMTVNFGNLLLYLLTASLIGQFGDLAMSSIKRIAGIKDYGNLLTGHGGILDRFDSLLFVLPYTYLFCL